MKKAVFAVFAALAASLASYGQSSPAVTQKEMVRYVGGVSNSLERTSTARLSSVSNYFDSVTPAGLSNRVQKVIDGASYVSNYYGTVESELVALSNFVGNVSPSGLSNYVDKAMQNLNRSIVNGIVRDDEFHFDETGGWTQRPMLVNGIVTNVVQRHIVTRVSQPCTNWGYRVVSVSGDCPVTNGTYLALSKATETATGVCIRCAFDFPYPVKSDSGNSRPLTIFYAGSEVVTSAYFAYQKLHFAWTYEEETAETNKSVWTWRGVQEDWSRGTVRFELKYSGASLDAEGREVTTNFTRCVIKAEPFFITESQWRENAEEGASPDDWKEFLEDDDPLVKPYLDNAVPASSTSLKFSIMPAPAVGGVRKSRGLPLLGGSYPTKPTALELPLSFYPTPAAMVDTIDYAVSKGYKVEGETPDHDDFVASPSSVYTEEDWYDKSKWMNVEFPIYITTYYQGEDGQWYDEETKVRNQQSLDKLLANYPDTRIPPRDYPGFTIVKRKSCEKNEIPHIWTVRPDADNFAEYEECKVCGKTREHRYTPATGFDCSTCINKLTKSKFNEVLKMEEPDGDGDYCGVYPLLSDRAYHAGWHHEDSQMSEHEDIESEFNCSCQCGLYSVEPGHLINAHLYGDGSDITVWTDTGDGLHHKGAVTCQRESCQHEGYVKRPHELEIDEDRYYGFGRYLDLDKHEVPGKCKANGCTYGSDGDKYIPEVHQWRASDCWCAVCERYVHSFETVNCGSKTVFYRCRRCHKTFTDFDKQVQTEDSHDAGIDEERAHDWSHNDTVPVDTRRHTCACGKYTHIHKLNEKTYECEGGYDEGGTLADYDQGCTFKPQMKNRFPPFVPPNDPITPYTDWDKGGPKKPDSPPLPDENGRTVKRRLLQIVPPPGFGLEPLTEDSDLEVDWGETHLNRYPYGIETKDTTFPKVRVVDDRINAFIQDFAGDSDVYLGDKYNIDIKYWRTLTTVQTYAGEVQDYLWMGWDNYHGTIIDDKDDGTHEIDYNNIEPARVPMGIWQD